MGHCSLQVSLVHLIIITSNIYHETNSRLSRFGSCYLWSLLYV